MNPATESSAAVLAALIPAAALITFLAHRRRRARGPAAARVGVATALSLALLAAGAAVSLL
jgi:predicted permease